MTDTSAIEADTTPASTTITDMGTHARLTKGQRRALTFAVCVVVAGMGMGFASSFTTLYGAAVAHAWALPWLLPLSVDSGIVAYVVLDHLAVTLGSRSRWLHLAAWALAAFTVWANAAVSPADGTEWRVIHAAMPALWVLGVEALRFMWHRLHESPAARADKIPAGRWLASPLPTLLLWRRMKLLNVTSWPRMAALEEARLCIADRIRAACEAYPDLRVPDALERVVRTGRLPAAIIAAVDMDLQFGGTSRMEDEAGSWTDARLTLRDQVSAALQARRQDIARSAIQSASGSDGRNAAGDASANAVQSVSATPSGDTSQSAPRSASGDGTGSASRKRRLAPARATNDELAEIVLPLFDGPDEVKPYGVIKAIREASGGKTGIGYKRAEVVLELARRMHRAQRVVAFEARR